MADPQRFYLSDAGRQETEGTHGDDRFIEEFYAWKNGADRIEGGAGADAYRLTHVPLEVVSGPQLAISFDADGAATVTRYALRMGDGTFIRNEMAVLAADVEYLELEGGQQWRFEMEELRRLFESQPVTEHRLAGFTIGREPLLPVLIEVDSAEQVTARGPGGSRQASLIQP